MTATPRKRRARRLAAAISGLVAAGIGAAVTLNWLASPRPWEQATGWDRIPEPLRPPEAPAWTQRAPADTPPEIAWLGHSGFLVRWRGGSILLDPNVSPWCTVTRRVLEPPSGLAAIGPVDAVLLSHAHFDHLDLPTLREVAGAGSLVVPRGTERFLGGVLPDARRVALVAGECASAGPFEICGVEAQHEGHRAHPFRAGGFLALGWIVRAGGDSFYYAGDTGAEIAFASIRERWHPRLAILPIGAWRPRVPMRGFHLSPEEAVAAAATLQVETVVPCHFGTFRVSADAPSSALPRFATAAAAAGVSWRMPRLLREAP